MPGTYNEDQDHQTFGKGFSGHIQYPERFLMTTDLLLFSLQDIVISLVNIMISIYFFRLLSRKLKAAESPAQGRQQNAFLFGFVAAFVLYTVLSIPYLFYAIYSIPRALFCADDPLFGCPINLGVATMIFFYVPGIVMLVAVWKMTGRWQGLRGCVAGYAAHSLVYAVLAWPLTIAKLYMLSPR
jgi:hypothetical protein